MQGIFRNFVIAVFAIKTVMNFIAINETKGTSISLRLINVSSLVGN